jgi:hypothetical protein
MIHHEESIILWDAMSCSLEEGNSSTLKLEPRYWKETSEDFYQTTQCPVPNDSALRSQHRENLKFRTQKYLVLILLLHLLWARGLLTSSKSELTPEAVDCFIHFVRLCGGISRKICTFIENHSIEKSPTYIDLQSGIRIQDPNVREIKDSTCPRPHRMISFIRRTKKLGTGPGRNIWWFENNSA